MGNVMIPQTTKEPVAWTWMWTTPSVHNNNEKSNNNHNNNNNVSNLWPICGAKSNPYCHHAHEKYNTSGAKEMDDVGSRNTDSTSGSPDVYSLYHCNKRKQQRQRQQSTSSSSSWFPHQRRRRAIQEELELLPSDVAVVHVVHHCHDRSVVPGVHVNASGTPPSSASTASSTPSCSPAVLPQRSVSIPMKNSKNNHNNNNNNKERLDPTSQQDQHQRDGIDCHQTGIAQDPHVHSSRCEQHYHDSGNRQYCHADATEAEEDEVDDDGGCDEEHLLQRFYDMRTWEMYLRITEARRRFAAAAAAARPAHALPPMMMIPMPIPTTAPTTAPTTREYQQQQQQPQYKPSNIVKDSSMTTSTSTTTNMTAENLLATAFHLRHHSVHRGHDRCDDDVDAVALAPVVCAPVAVDPQTWILQHAMAIMEPHLPPLHYGNNGQGQILCRGGASADAHANAGPGPTWIPILEPLQQQTVPWSGPVLTAVRSSCGPPNNNNLYMPWLSQHHTSSSLSLSSSNNDHEMIFGDMD